MRKARLEGGPEDGELDEGHILQSPKGGDKLGEEEEAQRVGKGKDREGMISQNGK